MICREISDKEELYKGFRIRPEEEKINVLTIVNIEIIPRGFDFFSQDSDTDGRFNIDECNFDGTI